MLFIILFRLIIFRFYYLILTLQLDTKSLCDLANMTSTCLILRSKVIAFNFSFFIDMLIFLWTLRTYHFRSNYYGLSVNLQTVGNPGGKDWAKLMFKHFTP